MILGEINNMIAHNHAILVDENNNILGIQDKLTVHNSNTPLHRGFSAFLFNSKKEFLIQQRSLIKKTWPTFWSNSFCRNPKINETYEDAIYRHAKLELRITIEKVIFIANYCYRFSLNNIVEHEICPIYLVLSDDKIKFNHHEVEKIKLFSWTNFLAYLKREVSNFTLWCIEEVKILENGKIFKNFMDSML